MGNTQGDLRISIWHTFSKEIPRGWPQNGCLYFSVQKGSTIRQLLTEINRHRRPQYHIQNLYTKEGQMIDQSTIIQGTEFYL